MRHLTSLCAAAFFLANSAHAEPLCAEFLSAEAMPKKYRKLAPVLSAGASDWIITQDQMDLDYVPSSEAALLLSQIVNEFEARGTKLAILMPPPRPLIAGQAVLDDLSGGTDGYDAEQVAASFTQMIDVVREAGAIAPNLLDAATQNDVVRDAFYYRHDTHWTPRGAAESAVALAGAVIAAGIPAFAEAKLVRPNLDVTETFSERGSLADMAKAVCGAELSPVLSPVPVFSKADMDLLSDTSARPQVLLAGSSFSNRYKKDAYRVADAISGALQAEVVNHSVSGGGAIGAIEGIVNAGLLDVDAPLDAPVDLVVWELPYTEGLRNIGALRQLLGALQRGQVAREILAVDLNAAGETTITLTEKAPEILALNLPQTALQRIKVELRFADGSKKTLGLVRKAHVPSALRSDWWAISLFGLAEKELVSAKIRYPTDAITGPATAHVY